MIRLEPRITDSMLSNHTLIDNTATKVWKIRPQSAYQRNTIQMAFRLRTDGGPILFAACAKACHCVRYGTMLFPRIKVQSYKTPLDFRNSPSNRAIIIAISRLIDEEFFLTNLKQTR